MTDPVLDDEDARELARSLHALFSAAAEHLQADRASALIELITRHVGCAINEMPNIGAHWQLWEHANVQRGVDAYLAEFTPDAAWFGIAGSGRGHEDIVDMLTMAHRHHAFDVGAVDYTTVAIGPDRSMDAVRFGMVCTRAPGGAPVVIAIRGTSEYGEAVCQLQVLAAARTAATEVRERVEQLKIEHDVFRGQILSFGVNEYRGNSLLSFQPRPSIGAGDVVLPPGVLETIERHVVLPGEQAQLLKASGQHLKRGLLLHGPPGTGKTHTVRHLMSRLTAHTFIVISGPALSMIGQATALARRLQPSVVVVEDVDLIAEDRSFGPGANPFLFELLNEMDGVASDSDVTFVLTTNRVEVLEHALVDRPGRVDLAVEIPRPDPSCRERLLRLYASGVRLDLPDASAVIAQMEGVTASFVRELVRRAVLRAAPSEGPPTVTEAALAGVLEEFAGERNALTRAIIGGTDGSTGSPAFGASPPQPGVWSGRGG